MKKNYPSLFTYSKWFYAEKSVIYILLFTYLFITIVPLVWVLSTSLKSNEEATSIPPHIIPLYIMFSQIGLLNSILGLILTFQILIIPLNIFLLKSYFETIPKELEEAALIDGCSNLGVLRRITIPLSMPGFAIAAVLAFRFSWNEFILPIVLANRPDSMVFQVALYEFVSLYRIEWGYLTAGINIALVPILVLMLIFQKQMIQGLTIGAV